MDIEEFAAKLNAIAREYGEDCYAKVSEFENEIDIYEARGQFITNIILEDK